MTQEETPIAESAEEIPAEIPTAERNGFQIVLFKLLISELPTKPNHEIESMFIDWITENDKKNSKKVSDLIDHPENKNSHQLRKLIWEHKYSEAAMLVLHLFHKEEETEHRAAA